MQKKCCTPHFFKLPLFLDSPLLVVKIDYNISNNMFVYGHIHLHSLGKWTNRPWDGTWHYPTPKLRLSPPPSLTLGMASKQATALSLAIHVRQQAYLKSLPAMRSQLIPHLCGIWWANKKDQVSNWKICSSPPNFNFNFPPLSHGTNIN